MSTVPAAPDCARCGHDADNHERTNGAPGLCYTDAVGDPAYRADRVDCSCTEYAPAADGPDCDGACLDGADLGMPYSGIAYPDPDCSLHGETTP